MGKMIYSGDPKGPIPKRYLVKYRYPEGFYAGFDEPISGSRSFKRRQAAVGEAQYLQEQGAYVEVIDRWK